MRVRFCVPTLLFVATTLVAQQAPLETSTRGTNSALNRLSALLAEEPSTTETEISVGKKIRVAGPVVQPFKVRKVLEAPRRVLDLVNPFKPAEREAAIERTGKLNTKAWATTVGFHPGSSAFADATTHEPTMSLLTVKR